MDKRKVLEIVRAYADVVKDNDEITKTGEIVYSTDESEKTVPKLKVN